MKAACGSSSSPSPPLLPSATSAIVRRIPPAGIAVRVTTREKLSTLAKLIEVIIAVASPIRSYDKSLGQYPKHILDLPLMRQHTVIHPGHEIHLVHAAVAHSRQASP
jgi:hypothetical protein